MDFGAIFSVLGTWGLAVLIGTMIFTQAVKAPLRKYGAGDLVFVLMPCIVSVPGVYGLVLGGQIPANMAVLVWFVVSFAGPGLYRYIISPALKKVKGK